MMRYANLIVDALFSVKQVVMKQIVMQQVVATRSCASSKVLLSAYFELCKPKVVMLMLVTSVIGMLLAYPAIPDWYFLIFVLVTNTGIALCSAAAATMNHLIDRRIDALMQRTHGRPLVSGRIKPGHAVVFATVLATTGTLILLLWVNALTAWLTLISLVGYAVFYTVFLKRATRQRRLLQAK